MNGFIIFPSGQIKLLKTPFQLYQKMGFLSNFVLLMAATAAVADPSTPKIASIKFSGNGCLKDPKFSGSFDAPRLTFSNFAAALPGSNQTVNCQVHLQTQGSTPGWQVALKSNVVKGHVVLSPGTTLTHYTTVYFSQDAAKTVSHDQEGRSASTSFFHSIFPIFNPPQQEPC